MPVDYVGYLYAASVAAGGYLANSKVFGLACGAILGYGAYLTSKSPPKPMWQLTTAVVLAGVTGWRFLMVGKRRVLVRMMNGRVMYPLFICIMSCAAVHRSVVNYRQYL